MRHREAARKRRGGASPRLQLAGEEEHGDVPVLLRIHSRVHAAKLPFLILTLERLEKLQKHVRACRVVAVMLIKLEMIMTDGGHSHLQARQLRRLGLLRCREQRNSAVQSIDSRILERITADDGDLRWVKLANPC